MSVRKVSSSSGRHMPITRVHRRWKQAVVSDGREWGKKTVRKTSLEEEPD